MTFDHHLVCGDELLSLCRRCSGSEGRYGVRSGIGRDCVYPRRIVDDDAVLCFRDCTGEMAILQSLFVVVRLMTVKMPPISSSRRSMASGVMTPCRRVNLSRRLISVSYAPDAFDEVIGRN